MEFKSSKNFPLLLASISGFKAVALGAFGAHILKSVLSQDSLSIFETGSRYQLIHSVVLLVLSIGPWFQKSALIRLSYWFFFSGIFLFSGSLYILAISGVKILGAVTPLGGLCFLSGWALLGCAAWKNR
ncbi:DUF423 domain-containing protein [Leptospira fluminis]|uniref:DUF423 domain-containing protein n=1 Tax=Leptospira fluminis TaxID=2484979 RepID=A0A4R9GSM0_9LEPT|nr:DUF423 domain-containing protein [Leptospira fluminis]TGK21222.1 DUF423 domain-containing protein [Leptospira fluminis]